MNTLPTRRAVAGPCRLLRRLPFLVALVAAVAGIEPAVAPSPRGHASAATADNGHPVGITLGPDGNLWFTENAGIGRITPGGRITTFPAPDMVRIVPAAPMGGECLYCYERIVAGTDGNLYFTQRHAIGRISVSGALTEFAIRPDYGSLVNLIAGPDGALWFEVAPRHYYQDGYIGRMTLDGHLTWFRRTPALLPNDLAAVADGQLWVTLRHDLARMSTAGQLLARYPLPVADHTCLPQCGPDRIVAGPDGNMWFTLCCADVGMGRSTGAGKIAIYRLRSKDTGAPIALAAGHDGRVWFAKIWDHYIGAVTTHGGIREFPVPGGVDNFPGITAGKDQSIWFTEVCANSIGRITPSGRVTSYHIPGTAARAGDWCLGSIT